MAQKRSQVSETVTDTTDDPLAGYATTDPAGQQLEPYSEPVDGEIVKGGPAMQTLIEWCVAKMEEGNEDEFAALERIVRTAMESNTPEQVLSEQLPISGKTFLDKVFVLYGFTITESEYGQEGDGCPFYANLDVTVGSPPEKKVINVGSWKIMAQLFALDQIGEWPQTVRIMEKKRPTRRGFRPLSLVPAV